VPLVIFESLDGVALVVAAPDGGRVIDLCDDHDAPVPFSCRNASCGTCRLHVLEGAPLLEPAAKHEIELLQLMGDDPASHRLACQARLRPGAGRIRVRACLLA
jgi:ferredoxin